MNKLIAILAAAMMTASCSEEEIVSATSDKTEDVTTVQVIDGKIENASRSIMDYSKNALAFSDEKAFETFKQSLENKGYVERIAVMDGYGVKNLYKLAEEADAELEEIGVEATSEEDFRKAYYTYVQKYHGMLQVNSMDASDLDLYAPDDDNIESFIANTDGVYVVDGEVRKAELHTTFNEISPMDMAQTYANGNNLILEVNHYIYQPIDGKKVYFTIARNYDTVRVTMYCKKSMWYGWKNDPKRIMVYEPHFTGAQISWIIPPFVRTWFNSKQKYENNIVTVTGVGALTGTIHTWTDMTAERDADGNVMYEGTGSFPCPVCKLDKSIDVTVNLPRTN